jgi:hypothetical protein
MRKKDHAKETTPDKWAKMRTKMLCKFYRNAVSETIRFIFAAASPNFADFGAVSDCECSKRTPKGCYCNTEKASARFGSECFDLGRLKTTDGFFQQCLQVFTNPQRLWNQSA